MLSNRPIAIPQSHRPPKVPEGYHRARHEAALGALRAEARDWFSREVAAKRYREDQAAADANWDLQLREGLSLARSFGPRGATAKTPTLDQEAREWLELFGRLDCRLDLSPYSHSLGYHMPDKSLSEAAPLVGWLDAAERRIPGITARVIEIAFNYDALSRVLTDARMKAEAAKRAAKTTTQGDKP